MLPYRIHDSSLSNLEAYYKLCEVLRGRLNRRAVSIRESESLNFVNILFLKQRLIVGTGVLQHDYVI